MAGRKTWTPEEEALLRKLFDEDTPRKEMAEQVGRSHSAVCSKLHAMGLTSFESRARQVSVSNRKVWQNSSPEEIARRRAAWSQNRFSRENRGLTYPPKYEAERRRFIRSYRMKAAEADQAVRALMKKDGVGQ